MSVWFKPRHLAFGLCAILLLAAAPPASSNGGIIAIEVYGVNNSDGEGVWHPITAELADTPELRQQGLMHRRTLPPDHGMLFVFPRASMQSFWMKNTYISLDIMYFASNGNWVNTRAHTPPLSEKSLPSAAPAQYVLEMIAGSGRRLGIGRGSRLVVKNCQRVNIPLDSPVCHR